MNEEHIKLFSRFYGGKYTAYAVDFYKIISNQHPLFIREGRDNQFLIYRKGFTICAYYDVADIVGITNFIEEYGKDTF